MNDPGQEVSDAMSSRPLLCVLMAVATGAAQPQGPYFGQTPPGANPEIFAPGVVSTEAHEFACSFTPDGKEFYVGRRATPQSPTLIMVSRLVDGKWSQPEPAPFNDPSARMSFEPLVTPDGQRLYFSSDRPLTAATGQGGMPMMNIRLRGAGRRRVEQPEEPGAAVQPDAGDVRLDDEVRHDLHDRHLRRPGT
jgi:hypothetical protein